MITPADSAPRALPLTAEALAWLQEWDPDWADCAAALSANPWASGVLPPRLLALAALAVSSACTNLDHPGTERWIKASLAAGASRSEVLTVIKMAAVMAIHSCSLAAPILLEEAAARGLAIPDPSAVPTPFCDRMRAMGQWNAAWDPFFALDPSWTDQMMAAGAGIYGSGLFTPKETELLSIAFDASFTYMYGPGTRRHIKGALAAGASVAEIFAMLKICTAQGMAALNMALPLLAAACEME